MFVTANQAYVFIAAFAFGGVFGVLYSFLSLFKNTIKFQAARIITDVIFFSVFSVLFVIYSYLLNFPSFRIYMSFGALSGLFVSYKSLGLLLANGVKKMYNIISKSVLTSRRKGNTRKWTKDVKPKGETHI